MKYVLSALALAGTLFGSVAVAKTANKSTYQNPHTGIVKTAPNPDLPSKVAANPSKNKKAKKPKQNSIKNMISKKNIKANTAKPKTLNAKKPKPKMVKPKPAPKVKAKKLKTKKPKPQKAPANSSGAALQSSDLGPVLNQQFSEGSAIEEQQKISIPDSQPEIQCNDTAA